MSEIKCALCSKIVKQVYFPMTEWLLNKEDRVLCGKCYSKKIFNYYPGKHKKINKQH